MLEAKIIRRTLLSQQEVAKKKFPTPRRISILQMNFLPELFTDGNCLSRKSMKRVDKNMTATRFYLIVPLVGLLLLGGCGQWSKPGATRLDLAQDRYQCLQGATFKEVRNEEFSRPREVRRVNRELFWSCMNSKGWELQS